MANNTLLVEEKSTSIGNFSVGRFLPFRKKRQVGPFTFVDHMGPVILDGKYIDVDQHPHIGLCTLTYLLKGSIEHRDSTGAIQVISAGDVAFMSSGKGVSHTERTPQALRNGKLEMHGYQIWIALPKHLEEMEPRFDFTSKADLPKCEQQGFELTLVAGKGFGMESPVPVHSNLFMVHAKTTERRALCIDKQLEGEIAIIVTNGSVLVDDTVVEKGNMLISETQNHCEIVVEKDSQIILFGGEPLTEERYLYWNFVSSSKERLEQAKADWENKRFPKVPNDDTYIPLPPKRF